MDPSCRVAGSAARRTWQPVWRLYGTAICAAAAALAIGFVLGHAITPLHHRTLTAAVRDGMDGLWIVASTTWALASLMAVVNLMLQIVEPRRQGW